MALGIRQQRLYGDTFDVWRQTAVGSESWEKKVSASPGFIQNTPNYNQEISGGLVQKESNLFTADVLHMEIGVDVLSGDRVHVTLERGGTRWYEVAGDVRPKPVHANAQECYVLPSVPPNGAS